MSVDERLEFLLKSTESLHASLQEVHANLQQANANREKDQAEQRLRWQKNDEQIDKLTRVMAAIGQTVLNHQDWLEKHS
jgi:prefoldin subunit 5